MPGTSEELLEAMTTVSRYFFRIMTQCLADLPEAEDVSATQYRTLAILALRGPRNASVLADELGVGRPAATKLVDRLVRRRLIRRGSHETDRRQVILEATERGRGDRPSRAAMPAPQARPGAFRARSGRARSARPRLAGADRSVRAHRRRDDDAARVADAHCAASSLSKLARTFRTQLPTYCRRL